MRSDGMRSDGMRSNGMRSNGMRSGGGMQDEVTGRSAGGGGVTRRRGALAWCAVFVALVALLPGSVGAEVTRTPQGIRFVYRNPAAGQVFLAGDFNGWNASATPMTREGDAWSVVVKLAPGEHEYKFVVDGNWLADPDNPTTVGSFGNSAVRVGARGEILEMEATSNTPLSPKIFLHGRYIGLFLGRRDEANQDRFAVSRPDFNIDLDFNVRVSSALQARVLTKIRNAAQQTPLWETSLEFDRGHLELQRQRFDVRVFDNDAIEAWGDPLHLVGDIGRYHHAFGFEQQGLQARGRWRGFEGRFVYADNFEIGDPNVPALDTLSVDTPGLGYDFNLGDTNKNVLALRVERGVGERLHLGASLRNDRGYNPGAVSRVRVEDDSTNVRQVFGSTNERWLGGGLDARWGTRSDRWRAWGELLYGEAWIDPGQGRRQVFRVGGGTPVLLAESEERGEGIPVDTSRRWAVGVEAAPAPDLTVRAGLEHERHGLADAATDSMRFFLNRALTYRFGLEWDVAARLGLSRPLRAGFAFESIDFTYPADAPWNTQLWFADRNFWMEHGAHRLPVGRFVQLGGADATTWTPWLEVGLPRIPGLATPGRLRYEGVLRGQEVDAALEMVESVFKLTLPVTPALGFYSQTRWVRYDDPGIGIDAGFVSTYAEVEYRFAPAVRVALSYGVDPFVLDVVTNEYDEIGINTFLEEQGATMSLARDAYLNLGTLLPRAEQALEDERRVQLEAIVTF